MEKNKKGRGGIMTKIKIKTVWSDPGEWSPESLGLAIRFSKASGTGVNHNSFKLI